MLIICGPELLKLDNPHFGLYGSLSEIIDEIKNNGDAMIGELLFEFGHEIVFFG
jgi:hypothetical protein